VGVIPPGVTQIAAAVAARDITATAAITAALDRIERSQETLNAFTHIDREGALDAASRLDAAVAGGAEPGPLAGVPIAVKDLIDQAGLPNTRGSSLPAPVPSRSAACVTRLEAAGAVMVGRTGLHEYAFGFSSENHWFGPVRNPWDLSLSPGGSSGGSAVAVAAGLTPAAIGTDTGGSVRVPAALCGVVGLKVTHGRIPLGGVFPLAPSLDTVGPLAGSVADAAALYSAMSGDDPSDPWSAPLPRESAQLTAVDPSQLSVAVPHPWVDLPQSDAVASAFEWATIALRRAGAKVVDVELGDLMPSAEINLSAYPEVAMVHRARWNDHPATYGPEVGARIEAALRVGPDEYVAAQAWRARIRHVAQRELQRFDALLTPAVAATHKTIGSESIFIGGEAHPYRPLLSRYSALVNHAGLPALTLPLDREGSPPPAVQLIGAAWQERRLLGIGAALERSGISKRRLPGAWFG
jgi:Asp-tRNA(Asn)/Glu-tRNA(Gln) amidotransferase A subunit family amidase